MHGPDDIPPPSGPPPMDDPPPYDRGGPPASGPGPQAEAVRGRVPPQDIEAERAVLGSVLIQNDAFYTAVEELQPEDFYRPGHQVIFRCMIELVQKSDPIDVVTLSSALKGKDELQTAGGLPALIALSEAVPTAANVKHYGTLVRKKSMLRKLINAATEIVGTAYEAADPEQAVDAAEKAIFDIAKAKAKQGITPVSDIVADAFKNIEKLAEQRKAITGVSTGIIRLDTMLAGLQPSDLVIVAGRPSMGKTAFSLGMGLHAATNEKNKVAVFSLEMSKESLVTRMLCSEGRIDASKLRGGFLSEEDWPKLARAAGRLSESPMFIDDTGSISVLEVRAKCRRLYAEHGLDLVIIDYLQLMKGSSPAQSREQEISEISRGLKALAKELHVPVVALSQLNRGVEQRVDKRPGIADLRESGAIEQDADVIMFVYRDEVYNKETEERGIAEIIIGKQRNGPIGTAKCKFFHQFTRFDNLMDDNALPPGA